MFVSDKSKANEQYKLKLWSNQYTGDNSSPNMHEVKVRDQRSFPQKLKVN
jgi:hypothetical protein